MFSRVRLKQTFNKYFDTIELNALYELNLFCIKNKKKRIKTALRVIYPSILTSYHPWSIKCLITDLKFKMKSKNKIKTCYYYTASGLYLIQVASDRFNNFYNFFFLPFWNFKHFHIYEIQQRYNSQF